MNALPRLVLSTVGASLLYNHLPEGDKDEYRRLLNALANRKELDATEEAQVAPIIQRAQTSLATGDTRIIRRASAELNGLYAFYEGQIERASRDTHALIVTDTALGRRCADLVKTFLLQHNIGAFTYVVEQMTTANTADFEAGSKNLMHWCAETLPGYREEGYSIVFNLVAAFKALQGYLNTIGMFYADQILYLFEGLSAEPVLIPRLPVKIDLETIKPFVVPFTLMAEAQALVTLADVEGLSPTLYDYDEHNAVISKWGLLTWGQVRNEMLSDALLPFPRLVYENSFERDYQRCRQVADRVRLQSALARVSALLKDNQGDTGVLKGGSSGGILYDNYVGKYVEGKPIGHFRVSDGMRVSCIAESGTLRLRHFGAHDYVNDNP